MNRRGFISLLGAGAAGLALDRAIPFNRVWSFPKNIVIPRRGDYQGVYQNALNQYQLSIGDTFTLASVNQINPSTYYDVITFQANGVILFPGDRLSQRQKIGNIF